MMALPIDMSIYKNYSMLLKGVCELVISAQMHQEIPFDAIIRALGLSYEAHRSRSSRLCLDKTQHELFI